MENKNGFAYKYEQMKDEYEATKEESFKDFK